jgi:hypothetical protein
MSLVTIDQTDIVSQLCDEVTITIDHETTGRPIYTLETTEVSVIFDDWAPTSIKGEKEVDGESVDLWFTLNRMNRGRYFYDVDIL